jgi:hypothetical protein
MFPRWGGATKSQVIVLVSESLRAIFRHAAIRRSGFCRKSENCRKKWLKPAFLPFRQAEKRRLIRYNAELGFSSMGRSFVGSCWLPEVRFAPLFSCCVAD